MPHTISEYARACDTSEHGTENAIPLAERCPATHPAYRLMLTEALRVGWPISYRNDLFVHDKLIIHATDSWISNGFVWVLRDYGTHLYVPDYRRVWTCLRYHRTHESGSLVYILEKRFQWEMRETCYDGACEWISKEQSRLKTESRTGA